MPDSCCAVGCTNRRTKDSQIPFYRIPRCCTPLETRRRREWIKAINRQDWTTCTDRQISNSRICGAHFINGKKSDDPNNPNWIPTIFSPFKQRGKKSREKRIKGGINRAVADLISPIKQEHSTVPLLEDSSPVTALQDNTTITLLRESSSVSCLTNTTAMASNYSPKPENVQLAFNPVLQPPPQPSGATGVQKGAHYSTPAQVARPGPPLPLETKPRPPPTVSSGPPPPAATHAGHVSYQSKYGELLNVIEDLGREIKPTYAGSKMAQERLKKGIMHARALVRECLAEVEKSARQ